jgi:hypothetical protein
MEIRPHTYKCRNVRIEYLTKALDVKFTTKLPAIGKKNPIINKKNHLNLEGTPVESKSCNIGSKG